MISFTEYHDYLNEKNEINEKIHKYYEYIDQLHTHYADLYGVVALIMSAVIFGYFFGEKATRGFASIIVVAIIAIAAYVGHLKDKDHQRQIDDYYSRIRELEARLKKIQTAIDEYKKENNIND